MISPRPPKSPLATHLTLPIPAEIQGARGQAGRGSGWNADRETRSSCGSGVGDEGSDTEGKAGAASTDNQSVASRPTRANALACSRRLDGLLESAR